MSMPGSLLSLVVWFSPSLTNYIIVERSNWRAVAWVGACGERKTEWLSVKIIKIIKFKHTHTLGEGRTRCHIFVCSIRRAWVVATSVKRLKCSPVIVCSLGWQRRTAAPSERWQQQQQCTGNNHIIWNHLISTKRLLLPLPPLSLSLWRHSSVRWQTQSVFNISWIAARTRYKLTDTAHTLENVAEFTARLQLPSQPQQEAGRAAELCCAPRHQATFIREASEQRCVTWAKGSYKMLTLKCYDKGGEGNGLAMISSIFAWRWHQS